ncbi:uncharacterized protein LOC128208976 [Mya arenaria]|uniref:uncharacterized protein LOC128208976 n=1 Tax=Mya arenaria TaxID=6604 RepID=UPI0022E23521|nr:uncharacterized protein LOC128208976 [Mya arenaria]XP_052768713.1 uncharacterized protein LOC128208976 [Mya arenaria]
MEMRNMLWKMGSLGKQNLAMLNTNCLSLNRSLSQCTCLWIRWTNRNLNTFCKGNNIYLRLHLRPMTTTSRRILSVFSIPKKMFATSSKLRNFGVDQHEDEYEAPVSDRGMNLRYHVENGYLSWMRNTYMATLAGMTVMNLEIASIPQTIGAVILLIGGMNVTAGTFGYLYGTHSLVKRGHLSKTMSRLCQLFALLHFVAWYIAFTMLFPELDKVDQELDKMEKEL